MPTSRVFRSARLEQPSLETIAEMTMYQSLTHWLARPLPSSVLKGLSADAKRLRKLAQNRLSRRRPVKTFTIADAEPPQNDDAQRNPDRDWLDVTSISRVDGQPRDIVRPEAVLSGPRGP